MRRNRTPLCSGKTVPALLAAASLGALIVATTCAEARIGVGRPGVGAGRVGSGLGFRPGVGVGRAGLGVGGWRSGVGYGYSGSGRGWGYGAAALTGAALGYGAANSYSYGYPSGYGYSGLYGYSPGSTYGGETGGNYAVIQFDGGNCEVWSNPNRSGTGLTTLASGLPNWDAGEAAYHAARAQGVCH